MKIFEILVIIMVLSFEEFDMLRNSVVILSFLLDCRLLFGRLLSNRFYSSRSDCNLTFCFKLELSNSVEILVTSENYNLGREEDQKPTGI